MTGRDQSGFTIQSNHGSKGNFELLVPPPIGNGMVHLWRANDISGLPWKGVKLFGVEDVHGADLIQSNFGSKGNLEVVARVGTGLVHFWRRDTSPFTWTCTGRFATGVTGNPALIQSNFGKKGNFELVVPRSGGGLAHYWRNNDASGLPWNGPNNFGAGTVAAVTMIQSNFGTKGNLEVVARVGNRLVHYWRMDSSPFRWFGPRTIVRTGVTGNPALIQSNFGKKGNFELVVPRSGGGLAHYWRNNDASGLPWNGPNNFGAGTVQAVSLMQSNFGSKGNLEVIAIEGNRLAHYWRRDSSPFTWSNRRYVAIERSFDVSECIYGWNARYDREFGRVTVRIQLNPDAGIPATTITGLQNTWRNGIRNAWNNRFRCHASDGSVMPLEVDVQWVNNNPHHTVRVRPGPAQTNMTTWDTSDSGAVAAHEFGHMLGSPDEYVSAVCPQRCPVATGTVMDNNSLPVLRHAQGLCDAMGYTAIGLAPV